MRFLSLVIPPLLLTAAALVAGMLLLRYVDLKPQVEPSFFFAEKDPQYQEDVKIRELFPELEQIVISAQGPLYSPEYLERLSRITLDLAALAPVVAAQSLVLGPKSPEDALKSPLWKRVLISKDGEASLVLLFMEKPPDEELLWQIEEIVAHYHGDGFRLKISGAGYVIELIRRYLLRDLQVFTLASFAVFAIVMLSIFHSLRLLLGTLVCCIFSGVTTLFVTNALKIPMGPLTANLTTMVFVMTLSHIAYMTFNWKHYLENPNNEDHHPAWTAVKITLPPSFWSMFTTFLGFGSLTFVQATPMQRLGVSGSIGTWIAFSAVYLVYPWFLRWKTPDFQSVKKTVPLSVIISHYFSKGHPIPTLLIFFAVIITAWGIPKINYDPSLLSYFKKGTPLRDDLDYMDYHWGTSALKIVIEDEKGRKFNQKNIHDDFWELQKTLEEYRPIGYAMSALLLTEEAKLQAPFGSLIPWEWILRELEKPKYGEIGKQYVSHDRTQSLLVLQMKSEERPEPRFQIVERVKKIIVSKGYVPVMIGGLYLLQGKLAELIFMSLLSGVAMLLVIFMGIGFLITHSLWTTLCLLVCLCGIPVWLLGLMGHLRIPLDMISAPATNLAIGMGVDAMIHLMMMVRHMQRSGTTGWFSWVMARKRLWKAVLSANGIVCVGFAVFTLSKFPPTMRFGVDVMLGTLMSVITALFVLPTLAGIPHKLQFKSREKTKQAVNYQKAG